jgi:hypothetical protein
MVPLFRRERERQPGILAHAIGGAGLHDPDHGVGLAAHPDLATDQSKVGAEMFGPELVSSAARSHQA